MAGAPAEAQWLQSFELGEEAGRQGTPPETLPDLAEPLPSRLRLTFYDGVAHGMAVPPEPWEEFVDRVDRSVPPEYRVFLYDGLLLSMTREDPEDVKRVMALFHDLEERTGHDGRNGIRIGLQRALGQDLAMALVVARRYPAELWPDLVEELGWRAGDSAGPDPDSLEEALPHVPGELRGSFVHGFVRGIVREPWSDEASFRPLGRLVGEIPPEHRESAVHALAAMLWIHLNHDPARLRLSLDAVRPEALRMEVQLMVGEVEEEQRRFERGDVEAGPPPPGRSLLERRLPVGQDVAR